MQEGFLPLQKEKEKYLIILNLATMDNKEFLETDELYITEVDFAIGKNVAELKKSINEKIDMGYRPIEQNPFFDKDGNWYLMVVYEDYEEE